MKSYRILALLLALVMVLGLTACGKDKGSDDPNHYELGDYVLDYKGACIMYDEYGRDALIMTFDFTNNSKESTSAGWAITSKCMQNGVQVETAYVLADADTYESITKGHWLDVASGVTHEVKNAFQLGDMSEVSVELSELWSGKSYTITVDPSSLERIENETSGNDDDWDLSWVYDDEDEEANDSDNEETEEPVVEESVASFTDWWEGDWYGWWIIEEADGDYADYEGYWWGAFGKIEVYDDMTGTIDIWDEDGNTENLIGASVVSFTANGNTEHGMMIAESGSFMGATFEPAEWVVEPAEAPYDEMIRIQGTNVGDNGSYHYSILLRPWGMLWDDVDEDDRPYYYNEWLS